MDYINSTNKLQMSESEVEKISMSHAQAVEAACWSPHLKVSSSDYEHMTNVKTEELCRALTRRYNQLTFNQIQFQGCFAHPVESYRSETPNSWQPSQKICLRPSTPQQFPMPIVPKSAPAPGIQVNDLGIGQFEKSGETKGSFTINDSFDIEQADILSNPFGFEADSIFRSELHSMSCEFDLPEVGFKL